MGQINVLRVFGDTRVPLRNVGCLQLEPERTSFEAFLELEREKLFPLLGLCFSKMGKEAQGSFSMH